MSEREREREREREFINNDTQIPRRPESLSLAGWLSLSVSHSITRSLSLSLLCPERERDAYWAVASSASSEVPLGMRNRPILSQ